MNEKPRTFTFKRSSRLHSLSFLSLGIVACLTGLALWQVTSLKTTYSLTEFLASGDSSLKEDATLRKRFKLNDSPWMFVVAERNTGWMTSDAIEDLSKATSLLAHTKGVKSVASLGTLETVVREHGEVRLGKLTDVLKKRDWTRLASETGVVAPVMISKDGHWAAMMVEVEQMSSVELLETGKIVERNLRDNLSASQILVGGVALVQAEMTQVLSKEVIVLGGLGAVAATLALAMLFSGFTAIAIAGITCITSNVIILGVLAALGQSLGVLSLSLPILVAVQTLSLTVHVLFAYIEIRKTESRRRAVKNSFLRLLLPNFLVSLATGVGFLTLATSNVIAMREFGLTVALASIGLWIITTVTIYPLLMISPEPKLRRFVEGRARWSLWVMRHRIFVLSAFAAAVMVSFSLITSLRVNYSHRLFDDLGGNGKSTFAANVVDRNLGGLVPIEIELALPVASWMEPANRVRLESIARLIRSIPCVGSVITPLDLFKFAGAPSTDQSSISEVETLFELAAKNPLKNFLRDDGRSARLSVRLRDVPGDQVEAGLKEISRSIASITPDSETRLGGWGSYIHRMNRELSQSLISGFWEALGVIFLLLVIVFRSFRWAAVSLIPSVLPPLFLVAGVSLFQIEMKPGLAIVFAIALGFAFINTIYLMKRVRDFAALTSSGRVTAKVVERAFWHESQSCFLSSLTLLIGFTTLCFSDFGVTRSFGMAMVFSMLAGILGDLILLPALLRQFPDLLNPRLTARHRAPVSIAASLAVVFACSMAQSSVAAPRAQGGEGAGESLEVFAKAAGKNLFARDERVEVEMTNVEPDGETETRRIELSRLSTKSGTDSQQKMVARILEPKSLKGTSVLTVTNGHTQSRWIYVPSSKQVRRVTGGDESAAPILGSELSTEDLDLSQVDGAKARIISRENGIVTIETRIANKDSAYSKCVAQFTEKTRLMKSAECTDRKGMPFKRVSVMGYRQLKGAIARPTEMKIENLKTKRFTKIVFTDQRVNTGLKPSAFTPEALRD